MRCRRRPGPPHPVPRPRRPPGLRQDAPGRGLRVRTRYAGPPGRVPDAARHRLAELRDGRRGLGGGGGRRGPQTPLEGYLLPATYFYRRSDTAEDVIQQMLEAMDKGFTKELRSEALDAGLTLHGVPPLASLSRGGAGGAGYGKAELTKEALGGSTSHCCSWKGGIPPCPPAAPPAETGVAVIHPAD